MSEDKQIKTDSTTPENKSTEQARLLEAWHISMAKIPPPKKGCFEATYPSKEWREIPSREASVPPMLPRRPGTPIPVDSVGNGNNILTRAPTGFISSATGSFDSVTGVASESGPVNGTTTADAYTLQLNTNFFPISTTLFPGAASGCQGWEQFVFYNNGTSGQLFIQYWLLGYGTTSPGPNWTQSDPSNNTNWAILSWANGAGLSVNVPNQPITNLANLRLAGTVSASSDSIFFSTGGTSAFTATGGNAVGAAAGWNIAEFGVFGPGNASQAAFTGPTGQNPKIVTRTEITYGGHNPPSCQVGGFTGETNNLTFDSNLPPAPVNPITGPSLLVEESTAGSVTLGSCSFATTWGDPHLITFKGLVYDFQAFGDFILAEVDPDFVVQTRQVPFSPNPNVAVNSAVATRMGKTKVAICLDKLTINGETTDLGDCQSVSTTDGVQVTRRGNVYFILSPSGYSVRATVNAITTPQSTVWIDVLVGLGNCSAEVKGLIANANGNVNQIAARDGTVLTNPFNFDQLYTQFADSWRVPPAESLLHVCEGKGQVGIPQKPFYASDLEKEVYERARAVCKEAGVEEGALLDACILDVAMIGNERAAQVFVGARPPIAVGRVVASPYGK